MGDTLSGIPGLLLYPQIILIYFREHIRRLRAECNKNDL